MAQKVYSKLDKALESSKVDLVHSGMDLSRSYSGKGVVADSEEDAVRYEGAIEINPLNNRPHIVIYVNSTEQSIHGDVNSNDLLDNDFIQLRFIGDKGTVHAYASNNSGGAFFTDRNWRCDGRPLYPKQ